MSNYQAELQRGWQIHQQRRFVEAERIYRQVLQKIPASSHAWCYLGIALHDQRRYAEAESAYRHALELEPQFPIALNNLGNTLRYLAQFEEADASFQRAIELKPDYFNAYKNRGTMQVWHGNLDLGAKYYQQALHLNPNDAELHRNLGVMKLLNGDFEAGWSEYRWRWRVGDLQRPLTRTPVWDGSPVMGKSILLTAEQGIGDTLNFVRFAEILRDAGAKTVVYAQTPLLALLQSAPKLGAIFPNTLPLRQQFDFQCSLLDVADILNVNGQNIPGHVPYLFAAQHLVNYWQQRLGDKQSAVRRIGIAWQGNPDHQADMHRSIPLRHYERLSGVAGLELYSLQMGFGSEQLSSWQGKIPIKTLGDLDRTSGAFMDTAAILQHLDLVITCDTAIVHLAGALGVPAWLALGFVPDWRWMLTRQDSPWYPSLRLFRQPKHGDWESVFDDMANELRNTPTRQEQA